MPSGQTNILNRAASAGFIVGDTLSAINASYARQVENAEGISLTGFVAAVQYSAINFHIDNFIEVYLFEDLPFPINQDIALLNFEPFLMLYYTETVGRLSKTIQEKFDAPYQLRYGHRYILLARLLSFVAAVPAINIRLTALGYENSQESPKRVILR